MLTHTIIYKKYLIKKSISKVLIKYETFYLIYNYLIRGSIRIPTGIELNSSKVYVKFYNITSLKSF